MLTKRFEGCKWLPTRFELVSGVRLFCPMCTGNRTTPFIPTASSVKSSM